MCFTALVLLVQRLNADNLAAFCLDSLSEKVLEANCWLPDNTDLVKFIQPFEISADPLFFVCPVMLLLL